MHVGMVRGPLGEGFVQPQIVPPAHGHQVSEPHVRHLVQDRVGALLVRSLSHAGPEYVILQERHATSIFHRAGIELRHEELVVLREGVGNLELFLEECETLLRELEDVVGVEVLGE